MSKTFRRVALPQSLLGELYLSSMPGRYRLLAEDLADGRARRPTDSFCLADTVE